MIQDFYKPWFDCDSPVAELCGLVAETLDQAVFKCPSICRPGRSGYQSSYLLVSRLGQRFVQHFYCTRVGLLASPLLRKPLRLKLSKMRHSLWSNPEIRHFRPKGNHDYNQHWDA